MSRLCSRGFIALCLLFAVPLGAGAATQGTWGQTYFDAGHTGYNPSETTLSPSNIATVQLLWGQSVPGGTLSFALDRGVIYAEGQGSSTPVLEAINASTGSVLWTTTTGNDGYFLQGTIAVAKGLVFTGCGLNIDGNPGGICAYSEATGTQVWNYIPDCKCLPNNPVSGPLVYSNGAVYFGDGGFPSHSDPYAAALSASSGQLLWGYDPGPQSIGGGAFAVGDGLVFFSCNPNGNVVGACALNQSTGNLAWTYTTGDSNTQFTFDKGVLYASVSSRSNVSITALKAADGTLLWSYPYVGDNFTARPVAIAKGRIYFTGTDGNLYALHAKTGKLIWSDTLNTSCSALSAPSVANGVIYVDQQGSNCPEVSAFATSNGALLWNNPDPGSTLYPPPIIAGGVLYIPNGACGSVCAYGLPGAARRRTFRVIR